MNVLSHSMNPTVEFLIGRDDDQWGPYSIEEVNQYLADGSILPTDEAWGDGMDSWVPIGDMQGVNLPHDTPLTQSPITNVLIYRDNEQWGPYSVEEVNQYLAEGSILPTDEAWRDGMVDWAPVVQIEGITLRLHPTGATIPQQGTNGFEATPPVPQKDDSSQYYFIDSNNEQFGPVSLKALISLRQSGALTNQSSILKEGEPRWQPFGTFPEATQAMELQRVTASQSLIDPADELSVQICGGKSEFDTMEDLISSVIGNSKCLGIIPVKKTKPSHISDEIKEKVKASGAIKEDEAVSLDDELENDNKEVNWPSWIFMTIGLLCLLTYNKESVIHQKILGNLGDLEIVIEIIFFVPVFFAFLFGWVRSKMAGIQNLPDVSVLTHSRFTWITGLTFNKKKRKFSFERVISMPKSQLEIETSGSFFTNTPLMSISTLSSDIKGLLLDQSSKYLNEERAIFGEQVVSIKYAKQILTSKPTSHSL